MASETKSSKVFSLEGRGLKLDTAADVEKYIKPLRDMEDIEEIRLLGNTLGMEACEALGEVLKTKKTLQVSFYCLCDEISTHLPILLGCKLG